MKKILKVLSVILLLSLFSGLNVFAEDYEIKIYNNDVKLEFENKPFFYENSVYVPLRELADKLGAGNEILWNDGKITIYLDGHWDYYEINIGKNEIHYDSVNSEINAMATRNMVNPPLLVNSSTYIPFEYIEAIFNRFDHYYDVSYIFGNIDSRSPYMDNAEDMTYSDICELQYSVDNGHFPWRLDAIEVIKTFASRMGECGEVTNFAGDGIKCAATCTADGILYTFELFKPIQRNEYGIWIVRTIEKKTDDVTIGYKVSVDYSLEDVNSAIDAIKETFKNFEGCELHSISYSGDKESRKTSEKYKAMLKELNKGYYEDYIVFTSSFRSPKEPSGAWNPDSEYTDWEWYLGRNKGEEWIVFTWGY